MISAFAKSCAIELNRVFGAGLCVSISLALASCATPPAGSGASATLEPPAEAALDPSAMSFPRLVGEPQTGTWYDVYPEGAVSALGEPYQANFKRGVTKNVLVVLNGGGVSLNAETAVNPQQRYFLTETNGDIFALLGLGADVPNSPFADWTVVNLPYNTGDFHVGSNEFRYVDEQGEPQVLHHSGYDNLNLVMNELREELGTPDKLVIAGYSAGGFGTALLSDHIMQFFPETKDVTVVVDAALLLNPNWQGIARDVWGAPAEIVARLRSGNITLDALTALVAEHPDVKILFSSSPRDDALVEVQSYIDMGVMQKTSSGGDAFEATLAEFVADLKRISPHVAVYIFPGTTDTGTLTQHTMLMFHSFSEDIGPISPARWIGDAVDGRLQDYGLELLKD